MIWAALTFISAIVALRSAYRASQLEVDVAALKAWQAVHLRDMEQIERELVRVNNKIGLEKLIEH